MILLDNAADGGLIYIQGRSSSCRRTTSSQQMNIGFDFDLCSIEYVSIIKYGRVPLSKTKHVRAL